MENNLIVMRISAESAYALRVSILNNPPTTPGDHDPLTGHFGAYYDNHIVGIASVYNDPLPPEPELAEWRLRGMAVTDAVRRRGIGHALLDACHDHVREHDGQAVWCNARLGAMKFYAMMGYQLYSDVPFDKSKIGTHQVMWFSLN